MLGLIILLCIYGYINYYHYNIVVKSYQNKIKKLIQMRKIGKVNIKLMIKGIPIHLRKSLLLNNINNIYLFLSFVLLFTLSVFPLNKNYNLIILILITLIWVKVMQEKMNSLDKIPLFYIGLLIIPLSSVYVLLSMFQLLLESNSINIYVYSYVLLCIIAIISSLMKVSLNYQSHTFLNDCVMLITFIYIMLITYISYGIVGYGFLVTNPNIEVDKFIEMNLIDKNPRNLDILNFMVYYGITSIESLDKFTEIAENGNDVFHQFTTKELTLRVISIGYTVTYISIILNFVSSLFFKGQKNTLFKT